jgi:hypothetical protein
MESDKDEVEDRVAKTQGALTSHCGIWRYMNLPLGLKKKVRILGILLYGCESWKVTKIILKYIRGFTTVVMNA